MAGRKPGHVFTDEQFDYLKSTLEDWSTKEALFLFCDKFKVNVSFHAFRGFIYRNNLEHKTHFYDSRVEKFISENITQKPKLLQRMILECFGASVNTVTIQNMKQKIKKNFLKRKNYGISSLLG